MEKKTQAAKAKPAKIQKAAVKEIVANDKVQVMEVILKPGAETDAMELPARVTRALKGGTLVRMFPGGKKEKMKFKTGDVWFGEAMPSHVVKNASQSTVQLYSVFLK